MRMAHGHGTCDMQDHQAPSTSRAGKSGVEHAQLKSNTLHWRPRNGYPRNGYPRNGYPRNGYPRNRCPRDRCPCNRCPCNGCPPPNDCPITVDLASACELRADYELSNICRFTDGGVGMIRGLITRGRRMGEEPERSNTLTGTGTGTAAMDSEGTWRAAHPTRWRCCRSSRI